MGFKSLFIFRFDMPYGNCTTAVLPPPPSAPPPAEDSIEAISVAKVIPFVCIV
jgi:hypothetical protein